MKTTSQIVEDAVRAVLAEMGTPRTVEQKARVLDRAIDKIAAPKQDVAKTIAALENSRGNSLEAAQKAEADKQRAGMARKASAQQPQTAQDSIRKALADSRAQRAIKAHSYERAKPNPASEAVMQAARNITSQPTRGVTRAEIEAATQRNARDSESIVGLMRAQRKP